jgi:hypothetical protein
MQLSCQDEIALTGEGAETMSYASEDGQLGGELSGRDRQGGFPGSVKKIDIYAGRTIIRSGDDTR